MSYLNIKLKKKLKFRLDLSQLIQDKIQKKKIAGGVTTNNSGGVYAHGHGGGGFWIL